MELYVHTSEDVSPNALRSTWNPTRVYISKQAQRTNMSHEQRTEGWLGTTCDSDAYALGVVDTDSDDWLADLDALLPDDVSVDREELEVWISEDQAPDSGNSDFECDLDTTSGSRSCTWVEGADDEDYWPTPRDGWTMIACYAQDNDVECLSREQQNELERAYDASSGVDAAEKIMELLSIDHDQQDHETYDSGTCGTDWAFLCVQDDDVEDAQNALQLAAILLDVDIVGVPAMEAMLKAWWALQS
jgi:hypothetical protein